MFYYLGIIKEEDVRKGNYEASFILCQSKGTSEKRSGWRVIKTKSTYVTMPKVLVNNMYGNEAMIDFLSKYRTRDHMHNSKYRHEKTLKYYPKGWLCWFECNKYGVPSGNVLYIKNVPDKSVSKKADTGFINLKAEIGKEPTKTELLTFSLYNNRVVPNEFSQVFRPTIAENRVEVMKEYNKRGKRKTEPELKGRKVWTK